MWPVATICDSTNLKRKKRQQWKISAISTHPEMILNTSSEEKIESNF